MHKYGQKSRQTDHRTHGELHDKLEQLHLILLIFNSKKTKCSGKIGAELNNLERQLTIRLERERAAFKQLCSSLPRVQVGEREAASRMC